MRNIFEMTVGELIQFQIEALTEDIYDSIDELERVCLSPQELSFMAGRITELKNQIRNWKIKLAEWEENDDDF